MSSTAFTALPMKPITMGDVVSPWKVFDKIWTSTMGYPAEQFDFVPGKSPIGTLNEVVAVIVLYYAIILGGREYMRNRPAYKLNTLFKIHNFFLTVVSGSLLVLFAEQMIPTIRNGGLYNAICGTGGWTRPLIILYYLNYLTKYYELLDTVFLFLKKKPLTFLHCYHHPATALLCYTQLVGHTPVSWIPISLNLSVHVVMYWYYFQSARGIKIWWKEWITRLQIAQFVIDIGFIYFASWNYWTSTYMPSFYHVGQCAGEPFAAVAGCLIITSYLFLFILFYIATYKKSGAKKSDKNHLERAAISMEKKEVPTVAETEKAASKASKRVGAALSNEFS